jgi:hypothetical protein
MIREKTFKLLLFFLLGMVSEISGQTIPDTSVVVADTTIATDTIIQTVQPIQSANTLLSDSVSKRPKTGSSWIIADNDVRSWQQIGWRVMTNQPWFGFGAVPLTQHATIKKFSGKELMFYAVILLLMIYAVLRNAFPKYMNDLFRLFFRTTIKQRQIREQLMQTPLPSLLMNGFFILTAGLYSAFVLRHYNIDPFGNFWLTSLYCSLGLSVAYFVKFLGLKFSGWLFNMRDAASAYVFIVFIVNKMIGILLLPFIIILAFTVGDIYTIGLNLSFIMIAGLLIYRFILTFAAVRNQVRVNPFHFFLYLLAFEVAPLLLVYKGLLVYFRQTA